MTDDSWQSFLFNQTNSQVNENLSEEVNRVYDLSPLGSLSVHGPDVRKFLQGQTTCDFDTLSPHLSLIGAHCNTKGRAMFSFRAVDITTDGGEPAVLLIMPQELIEAAAAEFNKYSVFSKVKIKIEQQPALLGLSGTSLVQLLDTDNVFPTGNNHVGNWQNQPLVQIANDRYLCIIDSFGFKQTWLSWQDQAKASPFSQWQLANIRDGLGEVWTGTVDEFIPQMMNFDAINAISFKKGCYIGQEVVARMQYRGKLKRHMRRFSASGTIPLPGADLYTCDSEQSAGKVVISAPSGSDTFEFLAVVTDSAFDNKEIYLSLERLVNLSVLSLPYAINN